MSIPLTPTNAITKALYDEAWIAIKTNDHATIRRLKSENPTLTMYSGFIGADCHCGCPGSSITLMGAFCSQAELDWETDTWGTVTTTDATHALLFELGLMDRDDADMIFVLIGNDLYTEHKELAADLLERHMELEKIRCTLILEGDGRLYSWSDMPFARLHLWMPRDQDDPANCADAARANAVGLRLVGLLLPDSAGGTLAKATACGRRRSRRLAEKAQAGICWKSRLRVSANAHRTLMRGQHIKRFYDHS